MYRTEICAILVTMATPLAPSKFQVAINTTERE